MIDILLSQVSPPDLGLHWSVVAASCASALSVFGVLGIALSVGTWRGKIEERLDSGSKKFNELNAKFEQAEKAHMSDMAALAAMSRDVAVLTSTLDAHKELTEQGRTFMSDTVSRIETEVKQSMARLEASVAKTFESLRDDLRQSIVELMREAQGHYEAKRPGRG